MFHKHLKEAMKELNINQTQLSNLTGIGKSSISQYISGKNIPEEKRRKEIATALGLEENYFEEEIPAKVQINREAKIPRLLPCDVADIMGLSPQTIRSGLQQGVFPWGYAIKTSENQWTYFINARSFSEKERVSLDIDF